MFWTKAKADNKHEACSRWKMICSIVNRKYSRIANKKNGKTMRESEKCRLRAMERWTLQDVTIFHSNNNAQNDDKQWNEEKKRNEDRETEGGKNPKKKLFRFYSGWQVASSVAMRYYCVGYAVYMSPCKLNSSSLFFVFFYRFILFNLYLSLCLDACGETCTAKEC